MLPKEEPLEAAVRYQTGIAILDLYGEINAMSKEVLLEKYAEAEGKGTGAILLNFSEVDYINSTGIALIVGLLARARQAQRRMHVYGLSDHYLEIFRITRLADFMSIHPDELSALQGAQAPGES